MTMQHSVRVAGETALAASGVRCVALRCAGLARLLTLTNVLITAHHGFLTHEVPAAIAETTLSNVTSLFGGGPVADEVRA